MNTCLFAKESKMDLVFKTEKVTERITRIFAFNTELMYLVEGDERAVLIDTGSGFGSLKACVDALTDKPLTVLLTHGHTDHALGSAEFEDVRINPLEAQAYSVHSPWEFRAGSGAMWPEFSALTAEQTKLQVQGASLTPWLALDVPLETEGTETTSVIFGTVPAAADFAALEAAVAEVTALACLYPSGVDRELRYFLLLCHNSAEIDCVDAMRSFGFSRANLRGWTGTAADNVRLLDNRLAAVEQEIAELEQTVGGCSELRGLLLQCADRAEAEVAKEEAEGRLVDTDEAFYLTAVLKNGATGTVETGKIFTGTNDDLSFEIYGTDGAVRFDLMDPNWIWIYDKNEPQTGFQRVECCGRYPAPGGIFPGVKAPIGWLRGHVESMYSFLNAVHTGTAAVPSFRDGAHIQSVMAAAYRSAESGRMEKVRQYE